MRRGFTLIELMVTLSIMATLAVLAAPQMRTMFVKRTVSNQADALGASLRLARSEAIKRGQPVTICASANPEAAAPKCLAGGATDWATGWLVFVDHNASLQQLDGGETVLKVQAAFNNSGSLSNNSASAITFRANGMVSPVNNSTFTVSPKLKGTVESLKDITRCVVISAAGRTRISKTQADGTCKSDT